MTYKRDPNVSFTDMCIYIDKNIYNETFDEEKCYSYMYHIFYMLAVKNRFFNTAEDYDEYALFASTRLFLRYRKHNLPVIKSVLNYAKKILYPTKVEYQGQSFNQVFNPVDDTEVTQNLQETLTNVAIKQNSPLLRIEFEYYLKKIPQTIKSYLKVSPYYNDRVMRHNIYISCLLSILNSLTLTNEEICKIKNKTDRGLPVQHLLEKIYRKSKYDCIILYNIDSNMNNYISTLVSNIYDLMRKDLSALIGYNEPSDAIIQSILSSPLDPVDVD